MLSSIDHTIVMGHYLTKSTTNTFFLGFPCEEKNIGRAIKPFYSLRNMHYYKYYLFLTRKNY